VIEMVRRLVRQKFGSPVVVALLALLALLIAFTAGADGARGRAFQTASLALIVLGAGAVSRDVSSGAVQMILARPLSRTDYLLGRWLGVLAAFGVFLAVAAALVVLFAFAIFPALRANVEPLSVAALLRGGAGALLDGLLFSATLLCLSTFLPGYGDLVAYFLAVVGLGALQGLGGALQRPQLTSAALLVRDNLMPDPDWNAILSGQSSSLEPVGRWALAVAVLLLTAAVLFRRREFAYGHD
jgi:ABC-type transport system involved in multi-copper enzyme maturation permease subunit